MKLAGKRIYLSGPVTDMDRETVEVTFCSAEKALKHCGATVFNPVRTVPVNASHELAMLRCLSDLTMTDWGSSNRPKPYFDLLVQLSGWRTSEGCKVEYVVARALGIEVVALRDLELDR